MMNKNDLKPFFEPQAVAVVGAPRKPGFGYSLPLQFKEQGWVERTFLVNRNGGELHGYKVLKNISELPDHVDLAIVLVGAKLTTTVVNEIGAKGIKHLIIQSAGFAETGEEGQALQKDLQQAAVERGIRLMGPNCVGLVNTRNRFTTIEVVEEALTPGPLGIIAQSGAFGNVLLDEIHQRGLFISKAVTLGNRVDVDESEILEYLHRDPDTRVIMMYLEGVNDGRRFLGTLDKVTRDKPVLILKSGRTDRGQAATSSHTGSLSGRDELFEGAVEQGGAIRCRTLAELIAMARVFITQPLPAGPRLGIITSSGSLGALAVDTAVDNGLILPSPSMRLVESLRENSPQWMSIGNPLDVGPSGQYPTSLVEFVNDDSFDIILAVMIVPYAVVKRAKQLGVSAKAWFGDIRNSRAGASEKPMVVAMVGAREFREEITGVAGPGIPVLDSPEPAAMALSALWKYARQRSKSGSAAPERPRK